ncbi:MAG TPA: DUF4328 domain-containing protein [Arenimonas sp.]|uniref:DUF4328 domain-containing protein n=1 Tax=Arenimonas sp. TaxID=1872635 RepID=UPI002D7ED466|nr:DUF4328 domain-containing protein [Arenimonas sp.]HEU0151921.1 DUF4328 domain-containing protein [Arenimonas sp.]
MAAKDRYESLDELGKVTVVLLCIEITLQALYFLATLARTGEMADIIAGRAARPVDVTPFELLQGIIGLALAAIAISLFFVIGRWIFRAAWNIRHLGAKRLEFSPGWAVGWYFVPFANLVYPFRAMKEIWLASHDPARWREGSVGLLTAWWTLWLAGNIIGNIALRLSINAETMESILLAERIGLVSTALSIPCSVLFLRIVRRVGAAQDRQANAPAPPAPPEPESETLVA